MPRRSTSELLPFDPEIKRTLLKLKKVKADNIEMEGQHSDRYNVVHSYHNEMLAMKELILGDCWRPTINENYSGIQHQSIDANKFKLKLALISIV